MSQGKSKSAPGRKCSVCSHPQVRAINSMINEAKSLRYISLQFGMSAMSVQRHIENCLKLEIAALIKAKKIENAVDHYREITEQLEFAKELREAARDYLRHPATGRIVLLPRADEVEVVYEDYLDAAPTGAPKRKTDNLDVLLERLKTGSVEPTRSTIKHVDVRAYALDAIRTIDTVLDKFAKVQGAYAKDNQQKQPLAPVASIAQLKQTLVSITRRTLKETGNAYPFQELYEPLARAAVEDLAAEGRTVSIEELQLLPGELEDYSRHIN